MSGARRWLWIACWVVWGLRGVTLFVDLGRLGDAVAVTAWVAFGLVLLDLSRRRAPS